MASIVEPVSDKMVSDAFIVQHNTLRMKCVANTFKNRFYPLVVAALFHTHISPQGSYLLLSPAYST